MWAIIVVLQLMFPRDSLSSIVSLLSLEMIRSHTIIIITARETAGCFSALYQCRFTFNHGSLRLILVWVARDFLNITFGTTGSLTVISGSKLNTPFTVYFVPF